MRKQKRPRPRRAGERPDGSAFRPDEQVPSDVLGSYTGTPANGNVPVQDADDL